MPSWLYVLRLSSDKNAAVLSRTHDECALELIPFCKPAHDD